MVEQPLKIPFIVNPAVTSTTSGLPIRPAHIATWTTSTPAGPSRHTALSDDSNSIWIHSTPISKLPSPSAIPPPPSQPLPKIKTPKENATSPRRPTAHRTQSAGHRSRADSIASSVFTSSSHARRVSAFSPPPSARIPTAVLSSATATVSASDGHTRQSSSDRNDLRDHLREQRDRDPNENVGLGIAFGRRSLHVHSKEDIDSSGTTSPTGTGTGAGLARSTTSLESARTTGGLRGWLRGDEAEEKERKKEMKATLEEVEVEREMAKEMEEEKREEEEMKAVEQWGVAAPKLDKELSQVNEMEQGERAKVRRIVLDQWARGRIVELKVFDDLRLLGVLRDIGILDLISLDTLDVVSSIHLEQPEPKLGEASSSKTVLRIAPFWSWSHLHYAKSAEGIALIIAEGIPWPCAMPSPNGEVTRVVMLAQTPSGAWSISAGLELPGTGPIAICQNRSVGHLLHFLPDSLTSYPIIFPAVKTTATASTPGRSVSSAVPSPNLLRPANVGPESERLLRKSHSSESLRDQSGKDKETGFAKFLAARRPQGAPKEGLEEERKAGIGEGAEVERDGYRQWIRVSVEPDGKGFGYSGNTVDVFTCDGQRLKVEGSITLEDQILQIVSLRRSKIAVSIKSALIAYKGDSKSGRQSFEAERTLPPAHVLGQGLENELVIVNDDVVSIFDVSRTADAESLIPLSSVSATKVATSFTPHDAEHVFTADAGGNVYKQSLAEVLSAVSPTSDTVGNDRLESAVTVIKTIKTSSGDFVVAGDEDGVIRIWTTKPFEIQGSITAFADPVDSATHISAKGNNLDGHLLCSSQDGTVALISLKEIDLLYIIPASRAPLKGVFIDGKDILLAYANGKARVWNHQTCEFRRSTGLDAAEDMLAVGEWKEILLHLDDSSHAQALASASVAASGGSDLSRQLILDVRAVGTWVQTARASSSPLPGLRSLLSIVLPFAKDTDIDALTKLGIVMPKTPVSLGIYSPLHTAYEIDNRSATVDGQSAGLRQIAIVALLRPFLDAPDCEAHAARLMAHYSGRLAEEEADLSFFASFYMDSSSDVQQAARLLFKARMERMTEEEIEAVVVAAHSQSSVLSAKALTVIGGIALHRYQSVNPSALKAAADAIFRHLSLPKSPDLALAIELASKGFATWQTYLDPMDLLRLLFHLATHNPPSTQLSAQARLAVLHIANLYPGLFMSTLSMDILDAETIERRTSIMKLCVFMARKKPGVIQNGLPRIAESVVRSLDPNVGKMREDVQETATVILNELVLAFSTIDFHSGTQRLAVGTHEGALIMYDLKTASRLYVLEPHHAPVSSVNFSPDGRRLITVSLEGGDVTVWKVGSSLSGFFNVGGPPRQGGSKGEPFKRIEFMRADSGPLAETSALSDIRVEWPGLRQAKVQIKETALTFET